MEIKIEVKNCSECPFNKLRWPKHSNPFNQCNKSPYPYIESDGDIHPECPFLKDEVKINNHTQSTIVPGTMKALPSDDYELLQEIKFIYKFVDDEIFAIIPELELCGEGNTESGALENLQLELLDFADEIYSIPEENLGKHPKMWKQILDKMIIRLLHKGDLVDDFLASIWFKKLAAKLYEQGDRAE